MAKKDDFSSLKVAIVCDWLTNIGGAEQVVKSLHELFPNAPIYTSQYVPEKIDWFKNADVRTGWMNHLPRHMHKFFPLLRCWYFSRLNLREYDLVISSTGAEAKAVKTNPDALNVCYMHAPTQYYWSLYDDYIQQPGFGWLDPVVRIALRLLIKPMRHFDKKFASRPDYIVSNSRYVRDEIQKYYGRESTVIFPPVNTDKFSTLARKKRRGFVTTSRQVPWKKLDLAIKACLETGDKLVVVGDGSEHEKLVALAQNKDNITFLPTQDFTGVAKALSEAEGYIFPSYEPFGIAPVEALSAGTPVIAYGAGGALDYVKDGQNGILFREQTTRALIDALHKFRATTFDENLVKQSAVSFSSDSFKKQVTATLRKWHKEKNE